jgi:large subunit ribosomal protein L18
VAISKQDRKRAQRRTLRVRGQGISKTGLARVSIFRSLNHIYAQIIHPQQGVTVVSSSSLLVKSKGDKKAMARAVGVDLAKRAQKEGLQAVYIDRGRYKYHGRVKELVEGLRQGGIRV